MSPHINGAGLLVFVHSFIIAIHIPYGSRLHYTSYGADSGNFEFGGTSRLLVLEPAVIVRADRYVWNLNPAG